MKKTVVGLLLFLFVGSTVLIAGDIFQNTGRGELAITTDSGGTLTSDSGIISMGVGNAFKYGPMVAKLKFLAPYDTIRSWSATDTIIMRLRTSLADGQVKTLDSLKAVPPCSLYTEWPLAKLATDTAFARLKNLHKGLFWHWIVTDTITDSTVTVMQPYKWEIYLKEL